MNTKTIIIAVLATLPAAVMADHLEVDQVDITADNIIDSRIQKHPATVETFYKDQIENNVNAATAAQTLKYLPSIQVRERYIGDRNGIIATRTIGTLSSAQSMLYADGVLLSNLLGNSYAFPPRWGMVSPEEIESISMMYGPFSSIYAGNSFGGVMSIKTRMPTKMEVHASLQGIYQDYEEYGTDDSFKGKHATFSLGDKQGDFAFWLGFDHLDNQGHPQGFSNRKLSTTAAGAEPVVTGADFGKDVQGNDLVFFGANSIESTRQDQIKFKVAYDITPTLKASYTLGFWDFSGQRRVKSYIKDAAGNPVYNGLVNFNGNQYKVSGLTPGTSESTHLMHAFNLQSNTKGFFDWQLTLSDYDYQKDKSTRSRASSGGSVVAGNPYINTIGTVSDNSGTGWTIFDARATLRPTDHEVDIGYHIDRYQLESETFNTDNWAEGDKKSFNASAQGETRTQALFVQDKWTITPQWALTTGLRAERWKASDGQNKIGATTVNYKNLSETKYSPKVSLSYEPVPAWGFRASFGQAYRFPTVNELYQKLENGNPRYFVQAIPELKPEKVRAGELTAERRFDSGLVRVSLFHEEKYDALIRETLSTGSSIPYDTGTCTNTRNCRFIQNVDHITTRGIEFATDWQDVVFSGLDLMASMTFSDAKIRKFKAKPEFEGNQSLRIPHSMLKAVATYQQNDKLTYSLAARYSGRQHGRLDNSDVERDTFGGISKFFIVDVKANYKFAKHWTASAGIDNLNNYKSYVYHPYPQRTGYVQVKFDY